MKAKEKSGKRLPKQQTAREKERKIFLNMLEEKRPNPTFALTQQPLLTAYPILCHPTPPLASLPPHGADDQGRRVIPKKSKLTCTAIVGSHSWPQ